MSDDGDGDDGVPLADLADEVGDRETGADSESDDGSGDDTELPPELVGDGEDDAVPAIPGDTLGSDDDGPGVRSGPLSDMADDLDDRQRDVTPEDDDLFESVDVGEVDPDELWEQVDAEGPSVDAEPHQEEVRTIKKSKYCQRCEYFAEPPEVACHHDGTTIRKEADMEHFEVVDCPKILEDERLENV
ncbi:hypothetical protein [Haloarchaeobius amylolyticus]|uniref:hypothetical protein n=1 Tax=Haloarchaeobius amylolyticus TaxID=1198296 RepID=UPI00226D569C|nr:hypothetical protein [Haloarchaeobius amylolyticus]